MIRRNITRIALLATTLLVAISSPVAAGQWKDRTTLTFSEPVKVPGTTLPAGTYVFELVSPTSARDVVKITDQAGSKVLALTSVVPTIRPEATEDIILLFTPMDKGSMPAIRGWYPPGGRHGHLFLYSREEARLLADRTKHVVLSRDVEDSRKEAGAIVVFSPGGESTPWQQDTNTQREWDAWVRQSTTPMVADSPRGEQAKVDDVEENPERYFGKTLSIDGTVDEVYGPHLFELDEPDWGQPEGDVLVFVPKGLLAAVRENDRVTVTGTLKRVAASDLLAEARWFDVDGIMDRRLSTEPVLVATRIVGGDDNRAMVLSSNMGTTVMPPGGASPIRDIATIGTGDLTIVGRRVALPAVTIHSLDRDNGLFVTTGNRTLFVLVNKPDTKTLRTGDAVTLEGVVLALPPKLAAGLTMPAEANTVIYVYAESLKRPDGRILMNGGRMPPRQ